jgi:hypothetical protein
MPFDLRPHENPRIDPLTDAARLRWVLEFTRRDLVGLTPEALDAISDDLRHAAAPWWVHQRVCTAMPAEPFLALQREICQGLRAFFGESVDFVDSVLIGLGHNRPHGGWALPAATTHLARVRLDPGGRYTWAWYLRESADERTAIIEGIARLIVKFDERLCVCGVCGTPFLRQHRQEYCTVRCSNKVRNRRRLERKAHQRRLAQRVTAGN